MIVENRIKAYIEIFLISMVFFLANFRSFIFSTLFPSVDVFSSRGWFEVMLWLLLIPFLMYFLVRGGLIKDYFQKVKLYPSLIALMVYSLFSVLWSDAQLVTLQRSLVFVMATIFAYYLGIRFKLSEFLNVLFAAGFVIMLYSYVAVYANPSLGTDLNYPYNGSWRGVFWHRNHLGSFVALFSVVFLVHMLHPYHIYLRITAGVAYIFSVIMTYYAASATGHILFVLLHIAIGVLVLWIKIRHRLTRTHYLLLFFGLLLSTLLLYLNLDLVLGIFNRNSSFTGRTGLWSVLLGEIFPKHPWFGVGFGTIWAPAEFKYFMQDRLGWLYPVMLGDNGFLDILLNLGAIGFILFILNYFIAWLKAGRLLVNSKYYLEIFPALFMLYTFFANITFSLFMELEVFIWMIMVAIMIIAGNYSILENQSESSRV